MFDLRIFCEQCDRWWGWRENRTGGWAGYTYGDSLFNRLGIFPRQKSGGHVEPGHLVACGIFPEYHIERLC